MKNVLKNKYEKGITLVALIVTIIVLLILAGVTIANITGGDDIMEQASTQRDKTKISSEKQILENAVISITNTSKHGNITEDNLRQELSNKNVEITKSGGLFRIVFKDSNNLYKMDQEGEYFYWEDMPAGTIYGKKVGTVLYLRGTKANGYDPGTKWNDSEITKVVIEEPIVPSTCSEMFKDCTALEEIENIENLHTENVSKMQNMFYNCNSLKNINLKYFSTEYVTNMGTMFFNCYKLENLNLNSFNTSKVDTMSYTFRGCNSLKNIYLNSFDTTNVKTMKGMFYECESLNILNIESFDTSKNNETRSMFCYCNNLKTIYVSNKFNTTSVTDSTDMFLSCEKLVGGNGTTYDSEHIDKEYAHIDGGKDDPGYFTLKP